MVFGGGEISFRKSGSDPLPFPPPEGWKKLCGSQPNLSSSKQLPGYKIFLSQEFELISAHFRPFCPYFSHFVAAKIHYSPTWIRQVNALQLGICLPTLSDPLATEGGVNVGLCRKRLGQSPVFFQTKLQNFFKKIVVFFQGVHRFAAGPQSTTPSPTWQPPIQQ